MKKCFLTGSGLLLLHIYTWAQTPVQWNAAAKKTGSNTFTIYVTGTITKGWHVYAAADADLGLEPLRIEWENENVMKDNAERSDDSNIILDRGNIIPLDYKDPLFDNKNVKIITGSNIDLILPIKINGVVPSSLKIMLKGFASNDSAFLPIEQTKEMQLEGGVNINASLRLSSVDLNKPAAGCGDRQESKGLLAIFLLGFGGGLLALMTPCIFPMIPVTVSFFTGKAKSRQQGIRNGILYGVFIFLIYLLASSPFHLIGNINPQIFNIISTNAYVNVFFFAVFILFALSFFGLFEIKLPSSVSNMAGSKSSLGSTSGIFFMALTLAIVSFSCTGIILGSLLVNALSKDGSAWQLTAGMGGFGAALALPFGLFAMFPQWIKRLPKSGGWMDTMKKSLAFVELALAIKFLSNADLVEHWGILKREVFIALWILIAVGLAFYLFGVFGKKKIGLQNADKIVYPKISTTRKVFGMLALLFALYLVSGITKTNDANLKLLSGFPPPLSYSIYGKGNLHGKGLEPDVINDYNKAIALSRQQNKPLLIDFTGWACVNCRKMEEQVWTSPSIQQLIKDNYILVSLYVDDRKKLPDGKTVGEKWAEFQATNFKQVTQPLYVVLSPDEKLMNYPVGYTPKEDDYKQWLECGLHAYKQTQSTAFNYYKTP